jgi:hypothetical protein
MGLRQSIQESQKTTTVVAVALIAAALIAIAYRNWPQRKPDLSQALYSDDDGQTWFADSALRVPPFDHGTKPAVGAQVYSYDDGSKQFCAYLFKYRAEAQKQLQDAITSAQQQGKSPDEIELLHDPGFINKGMMVKLPGPGHPWLAWTAPESAAVFAIHSPDGTAVDQCFAY